MSPARLPDIDPGVPATDPTPPTAVRDRVQQLVGVRQTLKRDLQQKQQALAAVQEHLKLCPEISEALDALSEQLFQELLGLIQEKLTAALQEILEQPISFRAEMTWLRNAASIEFWIERQGNREDILKGQGGSVANILSVGLRLFSLVTLPEEEHRRFLVLDEQDCWLRPDLVPRLVKIIHEASRELGFQVLMISHHDTSAFDRYADKIYRLTPSDTGVEVHVWERDAEEQD